MQLPADALAFLTRVLPEDFAMPVRLSLGIPAYRADCMCVPMALEKAASSEPGQIVIHPAFYEPATAAGLALLAHEMYHQYQFQTTPGLLDLYAEEEARLDREAARQGFLRADMPPYANRYEQPAYEFEAEVYREALAMGYPPGKHVPLLIAEQPRPAAQEALHQGREGVGVLGAIIGGVGVSLGLGGAIMTIKAVQKGA